MLFLLYVIACIGNAIVTIITFFLYVRARLATREMAEGDTAEEHDRRLADLDRRENRYQSIHFITLALFILFGVLILIHLSNKLNPPTITGVRAGAVIS